MLFGKNYLTWGKEWENVIWSDEKRFNLDGPDRQEYYWHDLRKEEKFLVSHQQGGGSIMVWAGFGSRGKK